MIILISIGIDVGSIAAKIAAYDGEKIIGTALLPTGWSPKSVGEQLLEEILQKKLILLKI